MTGIKQFNCIKICYKIKWIEVNYLSSGQYSANKNVRFTTSILRSDLRDCSDEYIVVKETITIEGDGDNKKRDKKLSSKNNAPFRWCISKINNIFIDSKEDLDIVMAMHNLLEYSDNYSKTSGSLWNHYKDQINDDANEKMMLLIIE